jgi:hypothetical protein
MCVGDQVPLYDLGTRQQPARRGVPTYDECKRDALHPDQDGDSANQKRVNVETDVRCDVNRTREKEDRKCGSEE